MAVVFLQVVNETLKRTRIIQGDAGELATSTVTSTATGLVATEAFTDSGRQLEIDLAIQLWQEAEHEVYGLGLFPKEAATATIVLVANQREYAMPDDFERIAGESRESRVFRSATSVLIAKEYRGGYAKMLADQPTASDWQGEFDSWAISPVTGEIRVGREPTSAQDGETWNVLYEKRLSLTSTMATETLPFSDTVAASLVPVVAEAHNRIMKKEFDSDLFKSSIVRALEYMTQNQPRSRYGKR